MCRFGILRTRSLVLAVAGLLATQTHAQTSLSIGDISLLGFNANAPDNLTFVTWVPLATNTVIKFTDNGFLSGSSSTTANNARGGENFVIWTANSAVAAGTVIKIEGLTATTGAATAGSASGLSGISNGGDQLFAYQGSATSGSAPDYSSNVNPTTFGGTMLFGLTFQGSGSATSWLSTGTATSNTSYLPSDLNVTGGNISFGSSVSHGQYTGSRTNQTSLADYKSLVLNSSNWTTGTGNSGTLSLDTTAFTVSAIPEPSTYAAIFGGLALVGAAIHRRRMARSAAAV